MSRRSDIRAYLVIGSDSHPADILEQRIGLVSDSKVHMGEAKGLALIRSKWHAVKYFSSLGRDASVEDHVDSVVAKLRPFAHHISSLPSECWRQLTVVCYYSDRIAMHFSTQAVKFLSEIGADIDVDLYDFLPGGKRDWSSQ